MQLPSRRTALLEAAGADIGVDGLSLDEVHSTIEDGVEYGKRRPRRVGRD
jgi:hypothetical protein